MPKLLISLVLFVNPSWISIVSCASLPENWTNWMDPSLLKAYEREFPRQLSDFTDLDMGSYENDTDEKRSGYLRAQDYWPNNGKCIPYWIDERFDTADRQIIKEAVRSMERQTHFCLSFRLRRNESEYISFLPGRRCAAEVGRIPGQATRILLNPNICIYSGILLHEMMHALGFFHEHNRPDRDEFVRVYWEHVRPDAFSSYNITPLMATYDLPYDYDSIMHAGAFDFARDATQPVIISKTQVHWYMGQRTILSGLDAVKVQRAYGCTGYTGLPVPRSLLPTGCGVDAHVDTPTERSKANSSYQSSELLQLSNFNTSEPSNHNETSLHSVSGTTDQSSHHWLWILLPAGISPAVIVVAAYRRRRICSAKQGGLDQLELRCEAHLPDEKPTIPMRNRSLRGNRSSPLNTNRDKDEEWEFPRDQIRRVELVGEGCFGQVLKAEAREPSGSAVVVAVKILKETVSRQETDEFRAELHIMKSLQPHTNVVRLLGCCTDQDPVYLIMEFVSVGKLQTYLRRNRSSDYYGIVSDKCSSHLTAARLISFALQIARGMLHLSASGILHRDLAARNILLTEDLVCKVSDFGLARDVCESHVYQNKLEELDEESKAGFGTSEFQ